MPSSIMYVSRGLLPNTDASRPSPVWCPNRAFATFDTAGARTSSVRGLANLRKVRIRSHIWLDRRLGHALLAGPAIAGLRQRKWNCTDSKKKQQIKRASDKMRFDGGINLLFHLVLSSLDGCKFAEEIR